MQTVVLSIEDESAIDRALQVLSEGGLVAFPTDTVYGLAGLVNDHRSIQRLFDAKDRDTSKAIAVLLGDIDHLAQIIAGTLPQAASKLAAHFWPGALTLVVPRNPQLPENISTLPTVGVRMPDHAFALRLLRASGPLATTSANLSGGANPLSAQDVYEQLAGRVELILDGGRCPGGVPSTVVDCTGQDLRILRQGAISAEDIAKITE